MPSRLRDGCVASLIAIVLAVILTWPIAARLGSAGRVDSGDGRHGVWNVAWVAHTLTTDPTSLFDANIFYPYRQTLAYSEANIIAGIVAAPVWAATKNPYASYNTVVLLAFAGAALSAFLLVRVLGGSQFSASIAGLMYGFSPYMFSHVPHIQLLMTFGPPLSLAAMHHFTKAPSLGRGALLGAALGVTGLACAYYGIFAGLATGLGLLWNAIAQRRLRQPRFWLGALMAAGVVVAMVGPFFVPYMAMRDAGFARSLVEARLYSTTGPEFLASAVLVHRWMLPFLGDVRQVLFPGFLSVLLALVAVGLAVRTNARHRETTAFYCAVATFALWLSMGPAAGLYTAFYQVVPVFSFLRAPVRFGLLVGLSIAVLAAMAITWLEHRHGKLNPWFASALVVIGLAESWVGPLQLADAPPVAQAYRRLAVMPRAPVAEFPFFTTVSERHRHTEYMLMSTFHWQPMINGYSDHIPADFFADGPALASFPSPEAWAALRARGVRWIVVHFNDYPADVGPVLRPQLQAMPNRLRLVVDEFPVSLYEVIWPMPPSAARQP